MDDRDARALPTYYGFDFEATESTRTGKPNRTTGRRSIAGLLQGFKSRDERKTWLLASPHRRKAVTRHRIKELFQGLTLMEFDDVLERIQEATQG